MVLPRVHLAQQPGDARPAAADQDKQVAGVEAECGQADHQLHMGQFLAVGADLVLAFDDEDAVVAQHPPRLPPGVQIKVQHRLVPAAAAGSGMCATRGIEVAQRHMAAEAAAGLGLRPQQALHVGRVENERVDRAGLVGQGTAIGAGGEVGGEHPVATGRDPAPEDALAEGDVGDGGPVRHMQGEDPRE